jgi:hypothetical protein
LARLLSPNASIIRGSIAGITYFSNQYHQIVMRARTAPVQPGGPYVSTIRSDFDRASNVWDSMNPTDRELWNAYASTCKFPGPLGEYTVPGRNLFMGAYTFLKYVEDRGLAAPSIDYSPPSITGFANIGPIIADDLAAPGTGFQVSVYNPNGEDLCVMIERSLGFKQSRMSYKGPWVPSASKGAIVATETSTAVTFTGLSAGLRYFYRVRGVIDDAPCRQTAAFISNRIAAVTSP